MNPLFNQPSQQPNQASSSQLNPLQLMQAMKEYQGTPEQAKEEFFKRTEAMGMDKQQVDQFLSNVQDLAKTFGFM